MSDVSVKVEGWITYPFLAFAFVGLLDTAASAVIAIYHLVKYFIS